VFLELSRYISLGIVGEVFLIVFVICLMLERGGGWGGFCIICKRILSHPVVFRCSCKDCNKRQPATTLFNKGHSSVRPESRCALIKRVGFVFHEP
jgi:hypothetical protein